jgi:alpha-beta hydrolase superfamily lysophospholipase
MIRIVTVLAGLLLAGSANGAEPETSVVTVEVRPGVVLRYLQLMPAQPKAAVLLFAGGTGYLNITEHGIEGGSQNFLVRSRHLFARHGLLVAVVDAPSDHWSDDGMVGWRQSDVHANDIDVVMERIRQTADVPLWLIGTSRGTLSVANAAARLGGRVDGLVLSASVTQPSSRRPFYLGKQDVAAIRVPTLLVHHRDDECHVTPLHGAENLLQGLNGAQRSELRTYSGGEPAIEGNCDALSAHGYLGIETQVVDDIVDWMGIR